MVGGFVKHFAKFMYFWIAAVVNKKLKKLRIQINSNQTETQTSFRTLSHIKLQKKKDASRRFCVNLRVLNEVVESDEYLIPIIETIVDKLKGNNHLSTFDLRLAYEKSISEKDEYKITFTPGSGFRIYEFNVMPFCIHNVYPTCR
ncbi:Transposon Ty3-I Gag-Pol polyprotein [Thelohanellus kitauei]|uniref:Transposon Ty3-I Gag-Pol polyprotein n=1 Tax=Thelohanellus kitauei TaxID=669202 RepID=A0A0C2JY43_THEKT|nr:Transposon Ty3-I Gag-Pol polyprotein [Thelohanellus kitauei]